MLAANDDSVMEIVCRSFNKKGLVTGDIGEIYSNIEEKYNFEWNASIKTAVGKFTM